MTTDEDQAARIREEVQAWPPLPPDLREQIALLLTVPERGETPVTTDAALADALADELPDRNSSRTTAGK